MGFTVGNKFFRGILRQLGLNLLVLHHGVALEN
jgi:hypothetical protein